MLFSYQFFTFSQLSNKFYIRNFQNIHLTQPKIKIKTYSEYIHDISMGEGARKSEILKGKKEIGVDGGRRRGSVIWAMGRCDLGRGGGGGGGTIWVGLGLVRRSELGVGLWVELRLVRGLELK